MRRFTPLLCLLGMISLPFACSDESTPTDDDDGGSKKKKKSEPTFIGAPGVTVKQVAMYQSLKRPLMIDGAAGPADVPLVAGREAVIRVFYETDETYDGSELVARLEIEGAEAPLEVAATLAGASTEEDINSTVNFVVPGELVGQTFSYAVGLLEEGKTDDENAAARWPSDGGWDPVPVEGPQQKLRVILAPFQYNYDGSGRVPDMSPEAVEAYRVRLRQIYPVSDVEVSVRAVTPWSQYIGPDGTGWQQVGLRLYQFRQQDGTADDVYYYGIFNPTGSFNQYCGGGCLLGVTLLNNDPPATGSVDLRLALGIGFPQYAADTMAHELGHSHGRNHAPCGGPDGIDPQYPHPGATLGTWGLDSTTMTLIPPDSATDIMGYCNKQWVSDYTFRALLNRGKNVNLPKYHSNRSSAVVVGIDGAGTATWGGETQASDALGGRAVAATLVRSNGSRTPAAARYFAWDHMPGGIAIVPGATDGVTQVEVEVDGQRRIAVR